MFPLSPIIYIATSEPGAPQFVFTWQEIYEAMDDEGKAAVLRDRMRTVAELGANGATITVTEQILSGP